MKTFLAVTMLAATIGVSSSANAAQFVTNGQFTTLTNGVGQIGSAGTTAAAGWSVNAGSNASYEFVMANGTSGGPGQFGNVSLWTQANGGGNGWNGLTAHGGNFAALDGAFQDSPMWQTITGLTVGQTYTLSFDYAFAQQFGFDGTTNQNLQVSLGGFSNTTPTIALANHAFSGWSTATFNIVATSANETLSFFSVATPQLPPFALVSNVSLVNAVPEPSTWMMILLGFGGLGYAVRLRKRSIAIA